jgi:hypothetical protein
LTERALLFNSLGLCHELNESVEDENIMFLPCLVSLPLICTGYDNYMNEMQGSSTNLVRSEDIEVLYYGNYNLRIRVLVRLLQTRVDITNAIGALIPLLKYRDNLTPLLAIELLQRAGANAAPAMPALRDLLLDDRDFSTRGAAARMLAQLGEPAVPHLVYVLQVGDRTAVTLAARSLSEIGRRASNAIPALRQRLNNDSSEEMRTLLRRAIKSIGGEEKSAMPQ